MNPRQVQLPRDQKSIAGLAGMIIPVLRTSSIIYTHNPDLTVGAFSFRSFGPVANCNQQTYAASSNLISSLKPRYSQRNKAIGTLPFFHK